MKIKIEIEMSTTASDNGWKHDETARLLRQIAKRIKSGAWEMDIHDNPDSTASVTVIL